MQTKVGTPYYVARKWKAIMYALNCCSSQKLTITVTAEVLKREYTKSCDIWSIGESIAMLLLHGRRLMLWSNNESHQV
jgi:serine/threonine protein kinase